MAEEISNNKGSSAGTKSDDQVSSANDFSLSDQSVIRNDSDGVGVLFGTEGIQIKNNGYTESGDATSDAVSDLGNNTESKAPVANNNTSADQQVLDAIDYSCLLYTSPSPRDS